MTRRRPNLIASIVCLAAVAACKLDTAPPRVGPKAGSGPPPAGLVVRIAGADVGPDARVAVTLEITRDDVPLGADEVAALRPALTLAGLATEPVSGLPAWRSYLPLGPQRIARLPFSPPGTPAAGVQELVNQQQPGAEAAELGELEDLGSGRLRYVFETPLGTEYQPGETLRVGVFMQAVSGTPAATATHDFAAAGAEPRVRELVLDSACATCHGIVRAHDGTRMGTKICVTCHTYQAVDPDTMDPAALATSTRVLDPNPLELARLIHRIHRGKNLPTLYRSSSSAPAPPLPSDAALPLPFYPGRPGLTPEAGRKYSVVGEAFRERVFSQVVVRSSLAGVARAPEVAGIYYPRDLRDCAVCHAGAADQERAHTTEISRRSCHGCHPDVWFGVVEQEPNGALDPVHFAHPGGPQADDLGCAECHVRSTANVDPLGPLAPLPEVHQAPFDRLAANLPKVEIVEVRDLRPGARPTIVFRVSDQHGPITSLDAPVPDVVPEASPVPRALWTSGVNSAVSFLIGGPFAGEGPEYGYRVYGTIAWPRSETVPVETVADAQGLFEYPFVEAVPEAATGAWTVVSSARRSAATRHYDVVTKRFGWPYTGETVSEVAIQNVVHVDTGTGAWALGDPRPASARRSVVDQAKCEACHRRLAFHGGTRNAVEGCLLCHTPERTDWNQRPKDPATGIVDLAATYDGVEEQSVHFKRMVLRIHTGSGQGTAVLGVEPYVVHGYGKRPFFFGEGTLPDELRRCDRCHLDGTWRIDALPEGAGATVANETATLRHANSVLHVDEAPVLPMRAACTSCHGNAYAAAHAARNTVNGEEGCLACHGARGTKASDKVHGLPATTSP